MALSNLRVYILFSLLALTLTNISIIVYLENFFKVEYLIKFYLFIFIFFYAYSHTMKIHNGKTKFYLKSIIAVNIFFIFLGYFESNLGLKLTETIGLHVEEIHMPILQLPVGDIEKRSFSIVGNPNLAAQILILYYAFYLQYNHDKFSFFNVMVLISILLCGSKSALIVYVLFHISYSENKLKYLKLFLLSIPILILLSQFIRSINYDSFLLSMQDRIGILEMASLRENFISIYDTDLALMMHQFGYISVSAYLILYLITFTFKESLMSIVFLYTLAGSLMFSTPILLVLISLSLIKLIGIRRNI